MPHTNPPRVIFSQMIDSRRIELYWDQEVKGAADPRHFRLSLDGHPLPLMERTDVEWNLLNVYEPIKKRSTLITREPLDFTVLGRLIIRADAAIVNRQGQHADPEVEIVVNNWHYQYTQFTNCRCGIPIESSDDVKHHTRLLAADLIDTMLSASPQVAQTMITEGARVAIYGLHEDVYDIPEHRGGAQIMDRPVEGYGGMIGDPITSISAANIERITEGVHQTRYPNESILAHEFGHAIHLLGINRLEDQSLAHRIQAAYSHAQETGLWPHTYLMGNIEEYFATLTSMWFNVMAESADDNWDGVRGPLNTRNELREYDPTGYDLLADIYPQTALPYPWNTNPVNHDYSGHMDQLP
ncbi:hypothetical protein [Bifidobacterium polysaccharolyticum]|uniref:Uncharacterized protein n=1 Tax=Bifidobacterium polysaccharolyticum TaxID=2750967 RepID=A0ABS0QUY6_9BIFI|nr:hypothetical protein [Bifidobacterium polysaccharolyticum]MBI0105190.1 hypothetical protein [Bifidobacterium polysaccharolyticum]